MYNKNLIEALLKIDEKNRYTFIHETENDFFKNSNHFIVPKKKFPGYGTYRKFFLLPKIIKKIKPDIVVEMAHMGPFRLPKNIKRVVIIHDLTPILFPKFHIKRSIIIHKIFLKRILKKADCIITTSQNNKKDILNYSRTKAKIYLVRPGVDCLENTTENKNTPYFLYLGTIEPRKNLETLISAFIRLKSQTNIPHKLILAGEIGWKSKNIVNAAKTNPDIILTGYVEKKDKSALYKNAEIFIYPSFYEGFGLPPLEAMSYGVPVICSNGGSLKEIYANCALIFDPKDSQELANKILRILKDKNLKQTLIAKGKTFSKNFSWEKSSHDFLQIMRQIN